VDEEQEGQEPELTFPEMMLSDIAEDVTKIRRNTSFLAGVLLAYLLVIGAGLVFAIVAAVAD
jgi:hypothetical protein